VKQFAIYDINNGERLCIITAQNGKAALKTFKQVHCLSSGIYNYEKTKKGNWALVSSYGSYFYAMLIEIKEV
jgi:hypothetical protein